MLRRAGHGVTSISGLVVEYIVSIDVTRVRFPADALYALHCSASFLDAVVVRGLVLLRVLGCHIRYTLAG